MLSLFFLIASDGWNVQMYNMMDIDSPTFGAIYSLFSRIFFQYILFNLLLAIIISAFIGLQKRKLEESLEGVDEHKKEYLKELKQYIESKLLLKI
jgi:hypothetical protein